MAEVNPKYKMFEGISKEVYIPKSSSYAYLTFKDKSDDGYIIADREFRYTKFLNEKFPDIVLGVEELHDENRNFIENFKIKTDIDRVFKKRIAQHVYYNTPGLFKIMCEIIDKLADAGYCYLDMKPENLGIVDGKHMIIDTDIVTFYLIQKPISDETYYVVDVNSPDLNLKEYYKQAGKLIGLINLVNPLSPSYEEASGLSQEELKALFSMGTNNLSLHKMVSSDQVETSLKKLNFKLIQSLYKGDELYPYLKTPGIHLPLNEIRHVLNQLEFYHPDIKIVDTEDMKEPPIMNKTSTKQRTKKRHKLKNYNSMSARGILRSYKQKTLRKRTLKK